MGSRRVVIYGTSLKDATSIAIYFFAGALIALSFSMHRPRLDVGIIAISTSILCQMLSHRLLPFSLYLSIPYLVVAFGISKTPFIRKFGRFGDPSYGIYLWGFPVQQALIEKFRILPFKVNILVVLVVSTLFGYASWHFVEKNFLKLKDVSINRKGKSI